MKPFLTTKTDNFAQNLEIVNSRKMLPPTETISAQLKP